MASIFAWLRKTFTVDVIQSKVKLFDVRGMKISDTLIAPAKKKKGPLDTESRMGYKRKGSRIKKDTTQQKRKEGG